MAVEEMDMAELAKAVVSKMERRIIPAFEKEWIESRIRNHPTPFRESDCNLALEMYNAGVLLGLTMALEIDADGDLNEQ